MSVQVKKFVIAEVYIKLETEHVLQVTTGFQGFECLAENDTAEDYRVVYKGVTKLDIPEKLPVYEENRFSVFCLEDAAFCRVFKKTTKERSPYVVSRYHENSQIIEVEYLTEEEEQLKTVQQAFLYIPWEWILMRKNRLMLHASFVNTQYGGLAFSGPSGIGKSTQSDLWCNYGAGKLINGDKTIFLRKEEGWFGYGSPYAGSSKCYVNDRCKLSALLFLKQGKTCDLKLLSITEAFKRIYAGVTVNRWDSKYIEAICELIQQIVLEIPIYEFTCTPDENAVYFLQKNL